VVTLYPFWYALIQSVSDPNEAAKAVLIPQKVFWMNYRVVFLTQGLLKAYGMTILRVLVGVPVFLFVTGTAAFVFTRRELRWRKGIIWFYLIPMYFSGGLIAFFVWMKILGLYDTFLVYVLPAAFGIWSMIVMKTGFQSIPESLIEAAFMDGAGYFRIFCQIILPLSLPMIATMSLFCAVTYWNDWFYGTFLIQNPDKWTLQTFLQLNVLRGKVGTRPGFASMGGGQDLERIWSPQEYEQILKLTSLSMETAYIMLSTIPIILAYPFLQKYFVKGVMVGSIKE